MLHKKVCIVVGEIRLCKVYGNRWLVLICAELLHHIVTLETIVHLASLQLRESGCWKGESLHLVRVRGSGCVKAKKVLVI